MITYIAVLDGQEIDISDLSNSELEEAGIPLQCECLSTYREYENNGDIYDVCVDCGASHTAGGRGWTPW